MRYELYYIVFCIHLSLSNVPSFEGQFCCSALLLTLLKPTLAVGLKHLCHILYAIIDVIQVWGGGGSYAFIWVLLPNDQLGP